MTILGPVRPEERRLVGRAALLAAVAGAAGAMAAAAADALFLAHVGARHLGGALAASSLLVMIVLAVVGGLADRVDRRRLLGGVAGAAAAGALALAGLAAAWPAGAGVVGMVVVKQLQAALDLTFWVVVAERLDARQGRRLIPVLVAAQGVGAVVGALAVVPLAGLGVGAVLGAAAALYVAAAALAGGLEVGRRVAAGGLADVWHALGAWRGGLDAVRRNALATHLAVVVAIAGAFASLAFYTLGAAAAAEVGGDRALAQFLGTVRGAVQGATLVASLVVAPRLLARGGVGIALVVAPAAAVVFAAGYEVAGALWAAVLVQGQARLLDATVQTPGEKLVLGLVPVELRGRVGGFVDGTAKRAGAIAGGLLALAMVGLPRALGGVMLGVALAWLVAAWRLRRRMPALAVAALEARPRRAEREATDDADADALADPRTIALLERDLAGAAPARAAEILSRLTRRGRTDARAALVAAAAVAPGAARPTVVAALLACAERDGAGHGAAALAEVLAARARDAPDDAHAEAACCAAGLWAAAPGPAALAALAGRDDGLGLTARIAAARARGGAGEVVALLDDALDDGAPEARRVALREARIELVRALRPRAGRWTEALEPARRLVRALRRVRTGGSDAAVAPAVAAIDALTELTERAATEGGAPSAEWVLVRGELVELARRLGDRRPDPARPAAAPPLAAAALRLLGALLEGGAVNPDEVRLFVHALGDRDDEVRDAAEDALRALGAAVAGELVEAAAYGRRAARDRAVALLRELPVTDAALDRMVAAELDALDHTLVRLAGLDDATATLPAAAVVVRRAEERAREIGNTVLLLLAARHRATALPQCARLWRHAGTPAARARALEILDAALPRAVAVRVVGALDEGPREERTAGAAARLGVAPPDADAAIRGELGAPDGLGRALMVHALGAAGRHRFRDAIAQAAAAAAIDLSRDRSPLALLRRITDPEDGRAEVDVPSSVETLLLFGEVPLLAPLSTRQLAELAERTRWQDVAAGEVVVAAGEVADALIVVAAGALRVEDPAGARTVGPGGALDELAVVSPAPAAHAVVAAAPTRLLRLSRVDFEELLDDVPGLGAAVCRLLGARLRG